MEEEADKFIKEVERSKARLYKVPGKVFDHKQVLYFELQQPSNLMNVAQIDEDYQMIDAHLDEGTKQKIQAFEYVDFSKLISKGKLNTDDQRMEIVNHNGMTYLLPISDREIVSISSYNKWEQAFRVYSNVLNSKHPGKATELLQYNHTIHTASMTYHWDNVYAYNKEFRHHTDPGL